jgi:transposase-like protein
MTTCPYCESDNVTQTTPCDDDNQQEYHCEDCGEYFTDECEDEK